MHNTYRKNENGKLSLQTLNNEMFRVLHLAFHRVAGFRYGTCVWVDPGSNLDHRISLRVAGVACCNGGAGDSETNIMT